MDEERLTLTQLKALRVADLKAKLAELGLPQSGKVKNSFESFFNIRIILKINIFVVMMHPEGKTSCINFLTPQTLKN